MLPILPLLLALAGPQPGQNALQARIRALCPLPEGTVVADLPARDTALAAVARVSTEDASWRALGCTRALMSLNGFSLPSKDEVLLSSNKSWLEGATSAFLRNAVDEDSPDNIELVAISAQLSMASKPAPPWLVIDAAAGMVLKGVRRGDNSQSVRDACAILNLAVSDTASARECLRFTNFVDTKLPTVTPIPPDVALHVVLYRVWIPETQQAVALTTFAYRYASNELRVDRGIDCLFRVLPRTGAHCLPGVRRKAEPQELVSFAQWDESTRNWLAEAHSTVVDTSGLRTVSALTSSGFRWIETTPGMTSWAVGVRDEFDGIGARNGVGELAPIIKSELYLSDIIFGSEKQKTRVAIGEDSIWLAPFEHIDKSEPVHLFFQVGSSKMRHLATTTLRVQLENAKKAAPDNAFQAKFVTPVENGITGVQKELVLSALQAGTYIFEVEVDDPTTGVSTKQIRRLVLR